MQVVAEQGADAVAIGEIARRAGVHETSIYRRWRTKERLMLDALLDYSEEQLPIPDTGNLRDDMVGFATSITNYLASPLGQTVVRSMAIADNDDTVAATRAQFWQSRLDLARVIVDRATSRRELPEDIDPAMVLELLIAPLHFRTLLTRQPVDEHLAVQVVDLLLEGLKGASPSSPSG